jgi:hypothetical protein
MKEYSKPDDPKHSKRIRKKMVIAVVSGFLCAYGLLIIGAMAANAILK